MPMEMGGKQAPCPACSRIIKVPMPKRTDGAAWKANLNQGPAAVRRDLEPVPEGMQGGARAEVSRETLEEADAVIARPRAPIPIKTRIRNAVTLGLWGAAAALALGFTCTFGRLSKPPSPCKKSSPMPSLGQRLGQGSDPGQDPPPVSRRANAFAGL